MSVKKWTLAEVKKANLAAGHFFFDRETLKAFGETMKNWAVSNVNGRVFVERIKAGRSDASFSGGAVGVKYEFYPETGRLSGPIQEGV